MATDASAVAASDDNAYDVYISCPHPDIAWARRLARDPTERRLRCFVLEMNVGAGEPWQERANTALDSSRALVVLWSPGAPEAQGVLNEISGLRRWRASGMVVSVA